MISGEQLNDAVAGRDGPPPELRFRHDIHPLRSLALLVRSRELIVSLAEREFRSRYKQATLGFAWALITPVTLMVVFTVFFRRVADIDTQGVPYALFAYIGLLPWTFFSESVARGGTSLVQNLSLLNKIYCPREVFPLASVLVAVIDTAIALLALITLFVIYGFQPYTTSIWVPLLLVIQLMFTVGVVLIASAVLVYVRDVRHALPIMLQLGLFATPVAYGLDAIPESVRPFYAALNPLGPVIEGYRDTILLGQNPDLGLLAIASLSSAALLSIGYTMFRRLEIGFADVA
jgi:ABC-type polysaccharide/polyol phosphate export permease